MYDDGFSIFSVMIFFVFFIFIGVPMLTSLISSVDCKCETCSDNSQILEDCQRQLDDLSLQQAQCPTCLYSGIFGLLVGIGFTCYFLYSNVISKKNRKIKWLRNRVVDIEKELKNGRRKRNRKRTV